MGTVTEQSVDFLERCIRAELNILISGGTGSGKTTLLNALSTAIPNKDRIVTIEDSAELRLNQRHVLRLESRPKNIEGKGEIPIRSLVRNCLRMRPDRIIVGEVRGAEALDMLQAMNTGHDGSLCTVHSNSPRDALSRVETMVLMSGYDLPIKAIRQQVASALDMIVHLERLNDGSRKVVAVTEVQGMESDVVTLQELFSFEIEEVTSSRAVIGGLRSTGLRPTFTAKFEKHGEALPTELFGLGKAAGARLGRRTLAGLRGDAASMRARLAASRRSRRRPRAVGGGTGGRRDAGARARGQAPLPGACLRADSAVQDVARPRAGDRPRERSRRFRACPS